jgi:integrase
MFVLMLRCGLRISEVANLQLADLYLDESLPRLVAHGKGSKESYTSYIGPDNFTIGKQDGQYIADRLNGKGVVVELRGGPADNSIGLTVYSPPFSNT